MFLLFFSVLLQEQLLRFLSLLLHSQCQIIVNKLNFFEFGRKLDFLIFKSFIERLFYCLKYLNFSFNFLLHQTHLRLELSLHVINGQDVRQDLRILFVLVLEADGAEEAGGFGVVESEVCLMGSADGGRAGSPELGNEVELEREVGAEGVKSLGERMRVGLYNIFSFSLQHQIYFVMVKVSGSSLNAQLHFEDVGGNKLYYSLGHKHNKTVGKTLRLAILNATTDEFHYVNDDTKVQFQNLDNYKNSIKKETIIASKLLLLRDGKTLTIKGTNKKGVTDTWLFTFDKDGLSQEWEQILSDHKNYYHVQANNRSQQNPVQSQGQHIRHSQTQHLRQSQGPANNGPQNEIYSGQNEPEKSQIYSKYGGSRVVKKEGNDERGQVERNPTTERVGDWNYCFIEQPSLETIGRFQEAACEAGFERMKEWEGRNKEKFEEFEYGNLVILVAEKVTDGGKQLKNEFRNLHYLMEVYGGSQLVNVPLSCLIEHKGMVALVKAKLPPSSKMVRNFQEMEQILDRLEDKAKIVSSTLLQSKCTLWNLSEQYGSNGDMPRLYVDDLACYLPELRLAGKEDSLFLLRPQLLQDSVNRRVVGGNLEMSKNHRLQSDILKVIEEEIKGVGELLSSEEIYISNIVDLKELLHSRGINMKSLFSLLTATPNKFVKRYLQTCLAAKIVKDFIEHEIRSIIQNYPSAPLENLVEDMLRPFIEGSSLSNNEAWKRLSFQYRNQYGTALSVHELEGGFFLGCLLTLLLVEPDFSCLDKRKIIFEESQIIGEGFVRRVRPKVKSYYRYQNQLVETCKYSKKDEKQFLKIVQELSLHDSSFPFHYSMRDDKIYVLAYLSDFVPPRPSPSSKYDLKCAANIYTYVNFQPPSTATIKITLNYFTSLVADASSREERERLEKEIEEGIEIINYWLGDEHPQICDFYQKLSAVKIKKGEVEEGLAILERSKEVSEKTQGKNPSKLGCRYYQLGEEYLKWGRKKQSLLNLEKARCHLEKAGEKEEEYSLTLMRLSSIELSNGKVNESISTANEAVKVGESAKLKDRYMIKIYQILCRGYEVNGDKENLKKLGLKCAKRFERTEDSYVFGEMMKISLTGVFAKIAQARARQALGIAHRLWEQGRVKNEASSLRSLMTVFSQNSSGLWERFLSKLELADKILVEMGSNRQGEFSDFLEVYTEVIGAVGVDFLEGLEEQKEYE